LFRPTALLILLDEPSIQYPHGHETLDLVPEETVKSGILFQISRKIAHIQDLRFVDLTKKLVIGFQIIEGL